ncbi:hypothetical protein Taro_034325 [Colocasia esculenta]|uniref:Uncharacterized protein n=1 Tax=Colocasia esculenta TaxID=4460 RepID=A0A843VR00_COLES|nr:hypothetical protein [Colocasia esculenta]
MRSCHVALLCVQENPGADPQCWIQCLCFSSDSASFPAPGQPALVKRANGGNDLQMEIFSGFVPSAKEIFFSVEGFFSDVDDCSINYSEVRHGSSEAFLHPVEFILDKSNVRGHVFPDRKVAGNDRRLVTVLCTMTGIRLPQSVFMVDFGFLPTYFGLLISDFMTLVLPCRHVPGS